jgi:hypothetical protein
MDPELVDRIYESSLVPELWPGVLDELSQLGESNSGSLFIASKDVTSWTSSTSARETTARFVNEGWFGRGQFFARVFAACHAGFTVDEDVFTAEEQDEEPLYRDFWRPIGFGRCTGTIVPLPTGEKIVLAVCGKTRKCGVFLPLVGSVSG